MVKTKVTVLMPVYNAEKYFAEAIESILNQTYRYFELLIINDGSTDRSLDIIRSFSDSRIRLVENEKNIKLIATLNRGIELAEGEYIVRMDADDVCLPQRIEKQVAFMDMHPEVGLCGSFMRTIGLENNYDIHYETRHEVIKFRLFFDTHFPHPTAIIRKSVLMENHLRFDKAYIHAEDFELWNRMAEYCTIAILPEILLLKRAHDEQVSVMYSDIQEQVSRKIRTELIERLGVGAGEEELNVYEAFLKGTIPVEREKLELLLDFFEKLVKANREKKIYDAALFRNFFSGKYWSICTTSTHLGLWVYRKYARSIFQNENWNTGSRARFFIKSVFRYKYHE